MLARLIQSQSDATLRIEYLMLQSINEAAADAQTLIAFLQGITTHINLIPYNPIENGPAWVTSATSVLDHFARQLRDAGHPTTIRRSLGTDIAAACGQFIRSHALNSPPPATTPMPTPILATSTKVDVTGSA